MDIILFYFNFEAAFFQKKKRTTMFFHHYQRCTMDLVLMGSLQ